jgi:Xaa-Pro dipeptidase
VTADAAPALPFAVAEYRDRLARVREGMRARGVDLLWLTGPENIFYLSGYHTTGYHVYQALLLPLAGDPFFVVRRIEATNVAARSWIADATAVEDGRDPVEATAARIMAAGAADARIGYEDQGPFLPPATLAGLHARLPAAAFVAASGVVEGVRAIKSAAEIAYLRQAAEAASAAFLAGADACRPGATENDAAAAVYAALVRAGSEYAGSPPFVAAGPRSAVGHATFAMTRIRERDNVWFEIGASVMRYNAGIGRTVAVGPPSAELARLSAVAVGAVEAMIAAVRPAAAAGAVDRAGRGLVEKAGLAQYWMHRGGYGLGVSFPPGLGEGHIMDIKPADARPLRAGMAFHLVPILLVPGVGAIGCTETVVVTDGGCEVLTTVPRELARR